ncbi:hypothetical protein ZWY2020_052932 [Hordeum vulgare]|nr:hypothetical protein ZWY2020_052932 [Hordeum vulgare]
MAPDAIVLALRFARPSHQPDSEHLNRIHPSRRARDSPEPLPARHHSFSVPPRPPWGCARGQALATPARPSTPGLALCLASAPLASDVHYRYDDVLYLLGIKYMVAVRKCNEFVSSEAGHALVGSLMPEYDPVAKISIIPRGQAGGLTFFAPSEERLESGICRELPREPNGCGTWWQGCRGGDLWPRQCDNSGIQRLHALLTCRETNG